MKKKRSWNKYVQSLKWVQFHREIMRLSYRYWISQQWHRSTKLCDKVICFEILSHTYKSSTRFTQWKFGEIVSFTSMPNMELLLPLQHKMGITLKNSLKNVLCWNVAKLCGLFKALFFSFGFAEVKPGVLSFKDHLFYRKGLGEGRQLPRSVVIDAFLWLLTVHALHYAV